MEETGGGWGLGLGFDVWDMGALGPVVARLFMLPTSLLKLFTACWDRWIGRDALIPKHSVTTEQVGFRDLTQGWLRVGSPTYG